LRIAVLIPCFNEAATVAAVISGFRTHLPSAAIVVGDNNSDDGTAAVARQAGAGVLREVRRGKGNMVRRMFADVEADLYVMVDGDATYDPSIAPRMIQILVEERCDLVNVARKPTGSGAFRRGHRLGNWLLTRLVGIIFGTATSDMLSGYKAFSRRFVKTFPAWSSGFEIETEIMIHALEQRMPACEIEAPYRERPHGSVSKLRTLRDGFRILRLVDHLVRNEHPLAFFATLAAVLVIASLGLGLPVVTHFLATGLVPRLPTAVLAASLFLCAVMSFLGGILLDALARARRESKRLLYLSFRQEP
jgi:glycosyltransferase involved in cell wall biosynthesis